MAKKSVDMSVQIDVVGADKSTVTFFKVSADGKPIISDGVTIERAADGHLVISAPVGTVLVEQQNPANVSKSEKAFEVGGVTEDGWVYVGVAKGQNVFAKNSSAVKNWEEAMDFAEGQNVHLGSDAELELLQNNIINKGLLKDAFDTSSSFSSGWVWGSDVYPPHPDINARAQRLSDGYRGWREKKGGQASVVLFR